MRKKGFTLIELLVVIAIIGILATIGLVALNGAREKARDATRKSDLGQIRTALVLYNDDNSTKFPVPDGSTDGNTGLWAASSPLDDYLSTVPQDPNDSGLETGTDANYYEYDVDDASSPMKYVILTVLEADGSWFWINSDGDNGTVASTDSKPVCGGGGADDVCN